jgi:hypothetical protein
MKLCQAELENHFSLINSAISARIGGCIATISGVFRQEKMRARRHHRAGCPPRDDGFGHPRRTVDRSQAEALLKKFVL